jgi:integrase
MPSIEYRPDRPKPYKARYWGRDGKLHSRSFARKDDAQRWLTNEEASKLKGSWIDPSRARQSFSDWADEWWAVWSSSPRRSPASLQTTESHLRLHIRPYFGGRRLGAISVQVVRRWQDDLEAKASYDLTMACRSILFRIMQAAEDDYLIPSIQCARSRHRGARSIPRPSLAESGGGPTRQRSSGAFWRPARLSTRDHFLIQAGTGLRSGELLGLRACRVDLHRRRIEIVDVRYDAGRFGRGYKDRPKSDASIRPVPLGGAVAEALARRLDGCPPDGLVFCGPGGSNKVPRGTRSELSVGNYRRVYERAAARAGLQDLDLHGPHDLRHTFATWLEDSGVPARVIDELMGHHGGRRRDGDGSAIGLRYRHMTAEMQARVVAVIDRHLAAAQEVLRSVQ